MKIPPRLWLPRQIHGFGAVTDQTGLPVQVAARFDLEAPDGWDYSVLASWTRAGIEAGQRFHCRIGKARCPAKRLSERRLWDIVLPAVCGLIRQTTVPTAALSREVDGATIVTHPLLR